MKKLLVFLLIVATMLTSLLMFACGDNKPVENQPEPYTQGLEFNLTEDNTYEVAGLSEKLELQEIVIPSKYKGKAVTSIKNNAFDTTKLNNILLQRKLKKVVLPSTVTKIGDSAFAECRVLSNINLDYVQFLGTNCFYNAGNISTGQKSNHVELPRVIEIGRFAFGSGNLSNLKTVVIGDTIQRFYTNSFSNTSLTSLAITGVDSSKWASLGFLDYGAAERFPNKQAFYGRLTPCARTIVDDGYISDAEKVYIGKIRIETPEALALQLKKKKTDRYDDCYLTNNYVYSVLKQADYDPTLESGWFITDIVNPKYLEYFNNTYK